MDATNVMYGPAPTLPTPKESVGIFVHKYLLKYINQGDALIDEKTNQKLTYRELLHASCRLAQSLYKCGITSHGCIGISSENIIEFVVVIIACLYKGLPVVPLNPSYTEYELDHVLKVVAPDVMFCSANTLPNFLKLKEKHPIKHYIVITPNADLPGSISLRQFLSDNSDQNLDVSAFEPRNVDVKDHIAFIMFSSGTTGLPKGVMITHNNINSPLVRFLDPTFIIQTDVALGVLPFFHAYGLQVVLGSLIGGKKIIILNKFDPVWYLQCVEKYRIASLFVVPPLMQFLANSEVVDKYDLSCVQEIACAAAPLSEAIEEAVKKRLNVAAIRQGYGLTECTLGVTSVPIGGSSKPGSVGMLNPGISCVIRDQSTGENLGPRQPGEMCVKGDIVMKGYYKNIEATADTFTSDGWLRTGDMMYYDEDGYFYVVDRIKELIKCKGFQVAPAELEAVLLTHPEIKDVGVVGVPDDYAGELPMAFVVKHGNAKLTGEDVQMYLANILSHQKHLRGGVRFVECIPKNPSGKILRRELKKMVATCK